MTGSNRRPPACKAGALPAELITRLVFHVWVFTLPHLRFHVTHLHYFVARLLLKQSIEVNTNYVAFSRKEVIQPHLPIRLPCYDFTPVTNPTVVTVLLAVRLATSGRTRSHGVTGGVYKARERIHRDMLIRDY